jgi:hypothetical protein
MGMSAPASRPSPSPPGERLRERLRQARHAPATPAEAALAPSRCVIELEWVTGNCPPRYQFRAVMRPWRGQHRIIATSPIFFARQTPVAPTPEARAALSALCDEVLRQGWVAADDASEGEMRRRWRQRVFRRGDDASS